MTFTPRAIEAAAMAIDKLDHRKAASMADLTRMMAEAALTAALAVDGMALQGWQDISTAPKNRPLLLAAYIVPSEEAQRNGSRPIWHIETGQAFGTKLDRWTNVLGQQPSHWMPLPPPPAASEGEERR